MNSISPFNNITSNTPLFFSSANSFNVTIYRRDTYPDTLEETIFRSILGNNREDSHSSFRIKRATPIRSRTKKSKVKNCSDALKSIKEAKVFTKDLQSSLRNVRCDFSNKDSEDSESAKKMYDDMQNYLHFNREIEPREVELSRFLFLSRIVFNSKKPISSDLVNKYLATLNQIAKLFWKPQPVSEPEKSKIKIIITDFLKYKLVKKCKDDEREAIHSAWKQCMLDIFSAFSSLCHITEECTAFAINYVSNLRDLIGIIPEGKKESIGGSLWSHLQGFIIITKNEPNVEARKALREELQIQNIRGVRDLINQANLAAQQDEPTTPKEDLVFSQNITEDSNSMFTDQADQTDLADEDSTTAEQPIDTMEAVDFVFSAEDEAIEEVTSIFSASINQTHVIDEIPTITAQSTTAEAIDQADQTDLADEDSTTAAQSIDTMEAVDSVFSAEDEAMEEVTSTFAASIHQALVADEVPATTIQASTSVDVSTVFSTQSITVEDVISVSTDQANQTYTTREFSVNTAQPTPTVEIISSISSIQDKTTNAVTSSTDQDQESSTISAEKKPIEKVTSASLQIPIIATLVGIASTLSASIGYIFYRKKKSEIGISRAKSSAQESTV